MNEHPIENLMRSAMDSIKDMVDVNTIIGDPIQTENGKVIIPISKVSFGFAAGGSQFNSETIKEYKKVDKDEEINYLLPFGGGAGAGVNISPIAFLIIEESGVKLIPINHTGALDRLLDYIPDLMERVNTSISKMLNNNEIEKKSDNRKEEKKQNKVKPKKIYNDIEIKYDENGDLNDYLEDE